MKAILLTKGYIAVVDDEHYAPLVAMGNWSVAVKGGNAYAVKNVLKDGRKRRLYMHQAVWELLGRELPDDGEIDHHNGFGVDNQSHNLRRATITQQMQNRRKRAGATSQYKGVCWSKKYSKWRATIKLDGVQRHLGFHTSEEDAAIAYDKAALLHFGQFAKLNLIPSEYAKDL